MTLLIFALSWVGSLSWYSTYGPFLWKGGPTVYVASMWVVLATASIAAAVNLKRDKEPFYASLVMFAVVLFGWHIAWSWGPPGGLRMLEHIALGAGFLYFGRRRWQHVVGFLFLIGAAGSAAMVLGLWPVRPRVFTGLYYPDFIAYLTHLILIVIGRAAGDAGIGNRLWRLGSGGGRGVVHSGGGGLAVQGRAAQKETHP